MSDLDPTTGIAVTIYQSVSESRNQVGWRMQHGSYFWSSDVYVLLQKNESWHSSSMNEKNRPLVTDDPFDFEKQPVEVQDFRKIAHHLWRNLSLYSLIWDFFGILRQLQI